MKSRKILTSAIVVAALIAAVAVVAMSFTACDDGWTEKVRPETKLLSLRVQLIDFQNDGLPISRPGVEQLTLEAIPEPVNEDDWDSFFNIAEADLENLWFLQENHTETARIIAEVTPGTVVRWGLGGTATRPQHFTQPGEPLTFGNNDVIYVQVSTRDDVYRSYYRICTRLASPVTLLASITVAGRQTKTPFDAGREIENWEELVKDAAELEVSIAVKEALGADILTVKNDDYATVRYARVAAADWRDDYPFDQLSFQYSESKDVYVFDLETKEDVLQKAAEVPFADQDILIAQVTAQNTIDKNYYKFRVSVGRIANIATLEMAAGAEVAQVLALGVPSEEWDSVVSGNFATAAVDPTFSVNITLEDEDGDYELVKVVDPDAPQPNFEGHPASLTFGNREELAIWVKSATLIDGIPATQRFYKVRVDLQSAIILVQPKSDVYYIESYTYQPVSAPGTDYDGRILVTATGDRTLDREIVPLKAVLDREGAFTYQWYTANSWYGGYGFDKDNHLIGDPEAHGDDYHPAVERLDEKNNVSLHNGGNEFYRLPYEGFEIVGATSAEYTPPIDASRRPFLPGFSNQGQYYWVVIKDTTGREVTSQRAVIITEWGEVFDMGKPTGTKVDKKHHIVNLNAYAEGGVGLQDTPRNLVPFITGKHGDTYAIPITFPDGFNVFDYSVVTCQAKFYLADGTPWIQNWTQGDFGFAKGDQELVLWYNLTNDNGTRGLQSSGNAPVGSGLLELPTHLIVKPAGETPPSDRPPFMADGVTPDKEAIEAMGFSAQGWFTPYIEIVELRFEGPAR